jgi:para-aminobenzoate synthetase component 1
VKSSIVLEEIPYTRDTCALFETVRDLPCPALLDSGGARHRDGRYDILVAQPLDVRLPTLAERPTEAQARQFFDELAQFHRQYYGDIGRAAQDVPFCGGIVGYLGYGLGNALEGITPRPDPLIPLAQLRAYDWCVVQDHLRRRSVLACLPTLSPSSRRDILARLRDGSQSKTTPFALTGPFRSNLSRADYGAAFEQIQEYILAGDCYQVNLTQRFSSAYSGDPWQAYRHLRDVAGAPFSAYIATPDNGAILSLSPERFIALDGRRVETSPIKGTRPRHSDSEADRQARRELFESEKDRAENLMIVDLLRNDLGRSCVPGSIRVDRLFDIQSFATVHHMVSTISGELRGDRNAWDLLRDSFPGGSITGAPKRRSMEIIHELEPHQRSIYCGAVLYVSADGRMDSNIAIRTFLCRDGDIHCWGGGGIVADSRQDEEYQETLDKVGRLLDTLESAN